MTNTSHLTKIEGVKLAWHSSVDLQAVRGTDDVERLYLEGKEVTLDYTKHMCPTQQVINFCHAHTKRDQAAFLKFFRANTWII